MTELSQQTTKKLLHVESLQEFFRESVGAAMAANQLAAERETAHYVVNLLTLFARSEAFHDPADNDVARRPLALMLVDALDAPTIDERLHGLQRLGDVSLFIAGFFADDLQDSVVDLDYYISMGGGAYSNLSAQSRGTFKGRALGSVFAELGMKFNRFVDVLNDVRSQASLNPTTDVKRLYDVWQKTGSNRSVRLLQEQGIYPFQSNPQGC